MSFCKLTLLVPTKEAELTEWVGTAHRLPEALMAPIEVKGELTNHTNPQALPDLGKGK